MKQLYKLILCAAFFAGIGQMSAQRELVIEADPLALTDIFPVIMGDTTATGDRVDNNTIYKLQNGGVYTLTDRLNNKLEWDLHIEAVDVENTATKPIITTTPNDSGTYPNVIFSEGNLTLRNLWIISGERGPLETGGWGQIRMLAKKTTLRVDDCLIEKDRGGMLQLRADSVKIFINNCEFRNGGNRRILEGNGRGFECRTFAIDTLVMKNTIVYNLIDRFFRSQGGTVPHNYVEIDHCTAFNVMGRHGFIQLGKANKVKITNNLFISPIMLGTTPVLTDEQTQPDNDSHKVITVDTLYPETEFTISNNNIFWEQEVTDHWATIDTVNAVDVLSELIVESMGEEAAANAFFSDPLTLNSVPQSALQYVKDLYADPTSQDMFDIIVEDIIVAGEPTDSGNLFDFSTWDPCYPAGTASQTGGTDGGPVGAVAGCSELMSSVQELPVNLALELKATPNPAVNETTISFTTTVPGRVDLKIFDFRGALVQTLINEVRYPGEHTAVWSNLDAVPSGMYFTQIATTEGRMFVKLVVQ